MEEHNRSNTYSILSILVLPVGWTACWFASMHFNPGGFLGGLVYLFYGVPAVGAVSLSLAVKAWQRKEPFGMSLLVLMLMFIAIFAITYLTSIV